MVLVMLFGLVGGLLSGIVGLYLSSAVPTDTRWYDPRPPLMIAKAVLGMLTALVGVMLIASKVLVGSYESLPSVLLLALVFGFSQLVVTQFLDKRIKDILPADE